VNSGGISEISEEESIVDLEASPCTTSGNDKSGDATPRGAATPGKGLRLPVGRVAGRTFTSKSLKAQTPSSCKHHMTPSSIMTRGSTPIVRQPGTGAISGAGNGASSALTSL